jgi:hypothetical protein
MLDKLRAVRDLRLQVAEGALVRAEDELDARREAEREADRRLSETVSRSAGEAAEADLALRRRASSGRQGITAWQAGRRAAQAAVETARAQVGDAVAQRLGQEQVRDAARLQWRGARFGVERLRLMREALQEERP